MRLTVERPRVLRYVLFSILLTTAALSGRDASQQASTGEPGGKCDCWEESSIHLEFREGQVHALWLGEHPLFSSAGGWRDRWQDIEVPASEAHRLLQYIQRDPAVEQAFVAPAVSLPTTARDDGASCPITTPSFESYQGYLGPAPQGIDAPAAWRRGVRGQGVWFADVEGGWNAKHEDLPGDRMTHAGGRLITDPSWRAHGTAVLGEVVGRDNGKGVVGIAPDVERVFTSSIGGTSVANALDTAARQLRPGDVMLIELQATGPRGRFMPVEYWDDNFDVIKAATDRGVIVIEAAGNGAENLDHSAYNGKLDRKNRDSGAIMVGAGGPARDGFDDRARLDFSNYGSRVDVQGWGRKVATLDYGDLQRCDDSDARSYVDRHYTDEFSGTSSASPIVAGAAVLVESYAKSRGGVLAPRKVRELLRATGTPQTSDPKQQIGPRPDLAKALPAISFAQREPDRFMTRGGQSVPDDVMIEK